MNKKEIIYFLLAAVLLAAAVSPFASPWPDGLEKVAGDKGFSHKEKSDNITSSPLADYTLPLFENTWLGMSLAGIAGTMIVFILGWGAAKLISRKL